MGRWGWSNRKTVEQCWALSVFKMAQDGVFKKGPGNAWSSKWVNYAGEETASIGYWVKADLIGNLYLELSYSIINRRTNEATPINYRIDLATTRCNFGGTRYWFICPLVTNNGPCRRKVGKLYLPPNQKYFGCRHCYNLTYKCQKEHDKCIDALLKNPALLESQLEAGDTKAVMAALKAWQKLFP